MQRIQSTGSGFALADLHHLGGPHMAGLSNLE